MPNSCKGLCFALLSSCAFRQNARTHHQLFLQSLIVTLSIMHSPQTCNGTGLSSWRNLHRERADLEILFLSSLLSLQWEGQLPGGQNEACRYRDGDPEEWHQGWKKRPWKSWWLLQETKVSAAKQLTQTSPPHAEAVARFSTADLRWT